MCGVHEQNVRYTQATPLLLCRSSALALGISPCYWSSAGRSFVMRSLKPCPENFDQIVVVLGVGGGGEVNYQMQIVTKLPNGNIQNYQLEMFDSGGGGGGG